MGLAGVSLGRELRALALSHTASYGAAWHRLRNSVTNSRADCALTQQMIGCIKATSPCVKSTLAKLLLALHTMSAPSGEERTLDAAAQVERARWCCGRFESGTHAWCGHATVMVLVSSASGPRVSGCIRAPRYLSIPPLHVPGTKGK
jgi:hypothetical protein